MLHWSPVMCHLDRPMSVFQFLYLVSLSSQALKSKWHPADQSPDIWQIWWAVRWAGPGPGPGLTTPARLSGQSGTAANCRGAAGELAVGEPRAAQPRPGELHYVPARHDRDCNQRWRCWNLSISSVRLPSQWQPAQLIPHPSLLLPASRRNGQCHSGQDNQGLAVYSHNRRFFLGKISN